MRIEKISDKQIRCTLTPDDLLNRHLNISELAYGSEKARSLFNEMLTRASQEFNFHAENMPLMIEAVPMSGDGIILLITKVEDPEELDTRFSHFSSTVDEDEELREDESGEFDFSDIAADDVIEEYRRLCLEKTDENSENENPSDEPEPDYSRIYRFTDIDNICVAGKSLKNAYDADNSLYKDTKSSMYYLVLHKGDHSVQTFNKICNIMSEYGTCVRSNAGTEAYFDEHYKCILKSHALQSLQNL